MLIRSKDRKVTNHVSPNGKTANGANSFGLPSGKAFSCPGATSVCENVCYAGKLEKVYKNVRNILVSNWEALQGKSEDEMVVLLDRMILDFRQETDRAIAKGKPATYDFRIHWDGDFFSLDYARAWARVIRANPTVRFWVYTRSFTDALNVLPVFDGIERGNLAFYLSVDKDNLSDAKAARKVYPWAKWAYLAPTFAEGNDDLGAMVEGKRYDCPENAKRLPLITEKGSACIRCGVCPSARGDVVFSSGKK